MNKKYNEFISENYDYLVKYSGFFCKNPEDLVGDMVLYIEKKYKKTLTKIINSGKMMNLFKRSIYFQINSNTSYYYKEYVNGGFTKKYNFTTIKDEEVDESFIGEKIEIEEKMDAIENELKTIEYKYIDHRLFELYFYDGFTYRKIEELTGINYSTIYKSVQKVREELIEKINNKL